MTLDSLCGVHDLSGVEFGCPPSSEHWQRFDGVNAVRFTLDGVTYEAIEDPCDGYRSCLSDIYVTMEHPKYQFYPQKVMCYMSDNFDDDVLRMADTINGKTVMRLGTQNHTDYYPCFCFEWTPENFSCNAQLRGEE